MDDSYIVYDYALDLPVEFVAFRASLEIREHVQIYLSDSLVAGYNCWWVNPFSIVLVIWTKLLCVIDLLFAYAQALVQRLSALFVLLDSMEGKNWQLKFALVSFIHTLSFIYNFLLSCIIRLIINLYLVTCYDASHTNYCRCRVSFNKWLNWRLCGISGTF